jgi:hypothetical protein
MVRYPDNPKDPIDPSTIWDAFHPEWIKRSMILRDHFISEGYAQRTARNMARDIMNKHQKDPDRSQLDEAIKRLTHKEAKK